MLASQATVAQTVAEVVAEAAEVAAEFETAVAAEETPGRTFLVVVAQAVAQAVTQAVAVAAEAVTQSVGHDRPRRRKRLAVERRHNSVSMPAGNSVRQAGRTAHNLHRSEP